MDEKSLEFWRNHSLKFLEMVLSTDRRGVLENADGYGKQVRECGDTVETYLTVRDGRIKSAYFATDGCLYSVACANATVHLVEGKTIQEAMAVTPEVIMAYLETLPPEEEHCAELAARSLHLALADSMENERHPWKKFYRKN